MSIGRPEARVVSSRGRPTAMPGRQLVAQGPPPGTALRAGVGLLVDGAEPFNRDMRVDLRCRQAGMT